MTNGVVLCAIHSSKPVLKMSMPLEILLLIHTGKLENTKELNITYQQWIKDLMLLLTCLENLYPSVIFLSTGLVTTTNPFNMLAMLPNMTKFSSKVILKKVNSSLSTSTKTKSPLLQVKCNLLPYSHIWKP